MPTPWHYHHMLHWWGGMLRIMSSSFPSPYSSLPITLVQSWSWSHLSIGCCSRTVKAFLDVVWQTLIWPSCFWGSPMVYILWWTLCIHSGEVFSWLLTLTHIHLPPGECSWSGQLLWRVFFFTRDRILRSSTTVVFRGLPGLWCCWAHRCVPSFKNVPNSCFGHA